MIVELEDLLTKLKEVNTKVDIIFNKCRKYEPYVDTGLVDEETNLKTIQEGTPTNKIEHTQMILDTTEHKDKVKEKHTKLE